MKKIFLSLLFLVWLASILIIFFVVQKPDFLKVLTGLKNLLFIILIPFWMTALAACLGSYLLPNANPTERLILGSGLGLGIFGLAGFGLAYVGWAKVVILWIILLTLTVSCIFTGQLKQVWNDTKHIAQELRASAGNVATWIPISAGIAVVLAFILSLAPPTEDFDALFYHLTVPAWWLRDGGLAPVSFRITGIRKSSRGASSGPWHWALILPPISSISPGSSSRFFFYGIGHTSYGTTQSRGMPC